MKNDLVSLIKRARSQLGASTYLWATIIVVVAGMGVSFLTAASQSQRFEDESVDFLNRHSMRIEEVISQRMFGYEQLLDTSEALFNTNNQISREQWREFINDVAVSERFPGTLGVGYAEALEPSERAEQIERVRQEGFSEYDITPAGTRQLYVPVTYIEPFNEQNRRAFGYDMFSEPARRAALEHARDSGRISLSSTVRLVQEGDNEEAQPGLLAYVPLYSGTKPTTVEQRRAQLIGFNYTALRMGDMFGSLLHNETDDDRFSIEILDSADANGRVLYQSDNHQDIAADSKNKQHISRSLAIVDKIWLINMTLDDEAFRGDELSPVTIFVVGSAVSALIGALIFVLMLNRLGRIAMQHELELQETKDELLALASHQLRTPASGVKQYIGMVLQGYSGQVSREQHQMLKRAYESNERQLEIINELLYVAKADAGQLHLEKATHNFTNLVKEVTAELSDLAKEYDISVKADRLKSVELKADRRYVRMIVENLLSNAIKYSFEHSEVKLDIKTKGRQLIFMIRDWGVGIDKEDLPKLFQKFTRISNELSARSDGSGIGLYLAQRLAEAHGGRVEVKSNQPRKGTTFTLIMPGVRTSSKRKKLVNKR